MKRPIGFSTGALALSDYKMAMTMLAASDIQFDVIEISALRVNELQPLVNFLEEVSYTLPPYNYIAVHAPSRMNKTEEKEMASLLKGTHDHGWSIILHADAFHDVSLWQEFGSSVCIENMDKRKPIGRTRDELDRVFSLLPQARLCFDVGHARQVDPTMTEAALIMYRFGDRLAQVHLSEVTNQSKHEKLSRTAIIAFKNIAHLIPKHTPIVLETPVTIDEFSIELKRAMSALSVSQEMNDVAAPRRNRSFSYAP